VIRYEKRPGIDGCILNIKIGIARVCDRNCLLWRRHVVR